MIYEYFANNFNPFNQSANIRILFDNKKLMKNYFLNEIYIKKMRCHATSHFFYWHLAIGELLPTAYSQRPKFISR